MKIAVDLHTHTNVSHHAYSTLIENIQYAKINGLKGIACTNHAPGMPDAANGWHFSCFHGTIPKTVDKIRVLAGAELNIKNSDGELYLYDYFDPKSLDVIIASMHNPAYSPENAETERKMWLNVIEQPFFQILGHLDRTNYEFKPEEIVKKAVEYGKIIEINNHSLQMSQKYIDNAKELLRCCKKYDATIVANTDSHFCVNIGKVDEAISLIEEFGINPKNVLNTDYEKTIDFFTNK